MLHDPFFSELGGGVGHGEAQFRTVRHIHRCCASYRDVFTVIGVLQNF